MKKQLYLILLLSVSISAMDKIQHDYEVRVWNQETFDNAWNDEGEMVSLHCDFNGHLSSFLIGRVDKALKKQKELGLEINLRNAIEVAEQSLPYGKATSTYKAAFDNLLVEDGRPKKHGLNILQAIRKYSFVCRRYIQDTYLLEDHLCLPMPDEQGLKFSDDEKRLITDTILPNVPHLDTEDRSFVLSLIDPASECQETVPKQ
jgi:hypothetical protein